MGSLADASEGKRSMGGCRYGWVERERERERDGWMGGFMEWVGRERERDGWVYYISVNV